jgi:hypothetical protein
MNINEFLNDNHLSEYDDVWDVCTNKYINKKNDGSKRPDCLTFLIGLMHF